MLFVFINVLDGVDFPFAGSQLRDVSAKGHFIDVVESIAFRGHDHRFPVFQKIIIVGNIQPFVVFVRVDDILNFCAGIIANEVKLILMSVEFENNRILTVGHPVDTREIAVGIVTEVNFGE